MANTISTRIADFLKNFPPFSFMDWENLEQVSHQANVKYFPKGEFVFEKEEAAGKFFYIVKDGAVELLDKKNDEEVLVEVCDEGDLFGLRALIAGDQYRLSARAHEDTLLYLIPTKVFQPILESNSKIAYYLASTFASDRAANFKKKGEDRLFLSSNQQPRDAYRLVEVQSFESFKIPVVCLPNISIQEGALIMTENEVGSIIVVNENRQPVGIVTDTDLRKKVATGAFGLSDPISAIMTSPVITISAGLSVAEVQITMIRHKVHHLCVTVDGTDQSPVRGVISEHDLLVIQGNSPAILVREINKCKDVQRIRLLREKAEHLLADYLEQEVAISFIADVMTEVNDAIIIKTIQMSEAELREEGKELPDIQYCWLALGSEGREEQLLRTDQDNALVFENVPEAHYERVKSQFLVLAEKVTDKLNEAGFVYCPADMMARNPKWCLSQEEWEKQFGKWIYQPGEKEVMHSTIFFDYRPVYGDFSLPEALTEKIYQDIDQQSIFLSFLAKNALQNPPPLSFFRGFIVERNGEHKNEFDIKARAMMPLVDAARVLTLHAKVGGINNTFKRYEKLAELEPQNRELFEQAADAYEILMRFRAMQGLRNNDTGRFFKPEELNKMQRLLLRNSFQPIAELQRLLKTRFRLGYMM